MAYYDKDRLLEEADSETIVEYLDIDTYRSGSNTFILCPGHQKILGKEDTNFGSCVLMPKGYYCFACKHKASLETMVMEIKNTSYQEALGIIGDALGGREKYVVKGNVEYKDKENVKILPTKDLDLIGLKYSVPFDMICFLDATKKYITECNFIPKPDPNNLDADYYLACKNKAVSLKTLLREAPKIYYSLVKRYAKNAMEKYQKCRDEICTYNKNAKILLMASENNKINSELIYDYKVIFNTMIERCEEIYKSISIDQCLLEDKEIFKEKKEVPKFDLFD